MKQIIIIAAILFACVNLYGQGNPSNLPPDQSTTTQTVSPTAAQNYVLTYAYRTGVTAHSTSLTTGQVSPVIQYFDGLGRPVETVLVKGSQSGYDVIDHKVYDAYGNLINEYLPYSKSANNGSFVTKANFVSGQTSFLTAMQYESADVSKGFTVSEYEKSPLNRVLKQGAPGAAWQLVRPVATAYKTNTSTENVKTWLYTIDSYTENTYPAGKLFVTETTDEDGKIVKEYKDIEGKLIQSEMNGAKTRYCYDQFGLLRCVVMPSATDPASADNVFKYKYDKEGRLIDKAMPIGDWVIYIYDSRDRLVLTQDGNQRVKSTPEWSYTIYDCFNRPVEQGTWAPSPSILRGTLENSINSNLTYMSGQASRVPMKYLYYNIYTGFPAVNGYNTTDATALGAVRSTSDIGRQTGEKTKLLNSETGMTTWLFTAIYYDKFGRVIQTVSDNHLPVAGSHDCVTNKYNFAGEVTQTRHRHVADYATNYTDTYFDLDHRGRLMKTRLSINGAGEVLMAGNNYNEAGNLAIQYLHSEGGGAFLQKNDYTYNIRGWVTQLNNPGSFTENDKFGMKLEYNTVTSPAIAKYNGNIAGFTWGTPNLTNARYVYTYDNNNRLTNANYTATANTYALDENFTYDANGNITAADRYNYSGTYIDRLVLTYQGNRVTGLKDIAGDNATVIDYPGTNNSLPYVYDYNGNVTNEPHKQLGIGYNMLNLPYLINWNGLNRKINYFYTFNGEKLRKTVEDNGTITKVDYCGPFVYETTSGTRSLKYFATPYGRAVKNGSAWVYEYNLTDHLGNVRVVIKKGANNLAEIVQQKGYYSFGMEISQFSAGTGTSKNWYNGKEIQDDFGLYWYDYRARFYDPALGRWSVIDNKAEKYFGTSPYTYALNNPIIFLDPDGNEVVAHGAIAQRNILNTLPKNIRSSVQFKKDGSMTIKESKALRTSTSGNLKSLQTLNSSETKYHFKVASEFTDGNGKTTPLVGDNDNGTKGVTLIPGGEAEPSPNSDVYIFTSENLSEERQAKNTAHEGYGHALNFEEGKDPYHRYEGTVIELGNGEWAIGRKETNTSLDKKIKNAEKETEENYRKEQK